MIQNSTAETQDDMVQDAIVVFVPENKYSSPFMIIVGTCIVNDKNNTSLNDHF